MSVVSIPYPLKGLHQGVGYNRQPDGTTPDSLNTRSYDAILERARGGQRNGTSKFFGSQIDSTNAVQTLDRTVALDATATNETVLWGTTSQSVASNDMHVAGLVMDPNEAGVVYSAIGPDAVGTANIFRSDGDLVEVWGKDILTNGTVAVNIGTGQSLAISSDGLYLFAIGKVTSSINLWVLNPADGSTVASTLIGDGVNDEIEYIHVLKKTDGTYRMSLCNPGASQGFFVVDYDASDNSFTTVWSDATSGHLKCRIGASEDILYVLDNVLNQVKRYNISTQSLAWSFSLESGAAGGTDLMPDGNGNLYVSHQPQGSPSRSLIKLADADTSVSETWNFETGFSGGSWTQAMVNVSSGSIAVTSSQQIDGIKIIDTSGAAAQTLNTLTLTGPGGATTGYPPWIIQYEPIAKDIFVGVQATGFNNETLFRLNPANIGTTTRESVTMAIAGGKIYQIYKPPTDEAIKTQMGSETVETTAFTATSVEYNGVFYICDGTSTGYKTATPDYAASPSPTSAAWTPTDGSLPTNGSFGAKLIELYRGRITLSGVEDSEQNIWFSKVGDPLDFNASPSTSSTLQPVVLNTGTAGVIGDIVNTLIPHNDDLLLIGGDHTIHVLRGNPAPRAGGRIDLVTDITGMWFGRCWCQSPDQFVYFMGTDGVYRMRILGDQISSPENLTQFRLEEFIYQQHTNRVRVMMAYDLRHRGVHVFFTTIASEQSTHLFYCERTDSWHKQRFPNDHGPLCVLEHDGDDPKDRTVLMGGRQGFIRRLDSRADDDDGTAIASHVVLQPIKPDGPGFNGREAVLRRLSATLGANTDSLTYEVRVGDDAEAALNATSAVFSGSWTGGGRQDEVRSRARGGAVSIKLSNTTDDSEWAFEELTATIDPAGPVRV